MSTAAPRYLGFDVARGVALVAMAIYHFCWDLELFGYLAPGTAGSGGLKLFARTIASSFLILVGISLTLAHARGINWRPFWKRWLMVAAAALMISIATYFATPGVYIYFGILHHIAFASIVGLAFLRAPHWLLVTAIVAMIAVSQTIALPAFDTRWLAWIGLYEFPPRSNDFVPVLPWFAAVLAGMLLGRWFMANRANMPDAPTNTATKPLIFIGQRSLAFYLLHQPILIALVYLMTLVAPPADATAQAPTDIYGACLQTCAETNSAEFCQPYCGCAVEAMETGNLLTTTLDNQSTIDSDMAQIAIECARLVLDGTIR